MRDTVDEEDKIRPGKHSDECDYIQTEEYIVAKYDSFTLRPLV